MGYSGSEKLCERTSRCQEIDPGMRSESLVFGAERCCDGIGRDVTQPAARAINTLILQYPTKRSTFTVDKFDALRR
jgi:hypothetical protein